MSQQFCTNCRKIHFGEHVCGPSLGITRRRWQQEVKSICNRSCEHWSTINGSTGCSLIPQVVTNGPRKPCDIGYYHRKGRHCFADPPKFLPCGVDQWSAYQQPSLDDHCVAVTALSRLPHHRTRQSECLSSWQKAGLAIVAVNQSCEIEELTGVYPQVSQWIPKDSPLTDYNWHTQRINHLADVAVQLGRTILLINSDIEIYGDQRFIIEPLENGEQIVGIRWNYPKGNHAKASRERWGLDAFSFTPEQARSLPRLRLRIGRPMWDYWIPLHSRTSGKPMRFIGEPFFYHEAHKVHWSKADWDMAAKWVSDHYSYDFGAWAQPFRKSFPYPP